LAAQPASKGHFLSKASALSEFIECLPMATDLVVISGSSAKLQRPDNTELTGIQPNSVLGITMKFICTINNLY